LNHCAPRQFIQSGANQVGNVEDLVEMHAMAAGRLVQAPMSGVAA